MTPFNINLETVILLFATLLTGLLAGVFFTWNNAITTGIGRLNDVSYLKAFQQMNRTILNPLFYIVFIGPLILSIAATYIYKAYPVYILWMLILATVIYFLGVFIVTISGNIPLNKMLDKTNLADISLEDARRLRDKFETKWNKLHLIRTISSTTSFLLLILTCLFRIDSI
jgi:uncharacterized membrane protein